MRGKLFFGLCFSILLVLSFISALEVRKEDRGAVVISELGNPAIYDFYITNTGEADSFEIYSLVGVTMFPKGNFDISSGTSKIEVQAYPSDEMRKTGGYYNIEYQIKGQKQGIFKDMLSLKVVNLKDTLALETISFNPDSTQAVVVVKNKENTNMNDVKLHFSSTFFDVTKLISLKPHENTNFTVELDKNALRRSEAGPYILSAEVNYNGKNVNIEGIINYLEKEDISVNKTVDGFIVRKTTITKSNVGNVPAVARIEISKDIITRLFTVFSVEPMESERSWFFVDYAWEKKLNPSESISVNIKSTYTAPLIFILLIILIFFLVRKYTRTSVVVEKRVSFVKTRGGEFALKVKLYVKARKHVDNVQIIDRLPSIMKIYEKYGRMPDKTDAQTRRMFWNAGSLNSGEERVLSYIMYTNIKVVGRFELPAATAIFEREGKTGEAWSNRTFFASETLHRLED